MPISVGTRLRLAQVISSDPVTVRPLGSSVEMAAYENFAGPVTVGQQVLTGFDESGRLVVFAQTTNPDYIPNTAGAITSVNLADATITREHILAGAIDRTRIAQGEVTAALIAIDAINGTHISAGSITSPLIAANAIVGYHIVANSISASQIVAYSITAQEIAAQSITASRILAGTITADRIATNTLTANEIATGAITSDEILTGTIVAGDIQAGTLTSASGVFGAISASDITTGTLNADRIGAGTLTVGTIILNGAVLRSNNYNGDFTGAVGWSMNNGTAIFNNVTVRGVLSGATGSFAGSLSAATGSFAGSLSAATGTFAGSLSAASGTFTGTVSAGTISGGTISGTAISGGTINIGSGAFQVASNGTVTFSNSTELRWGASMYLSGYTAVNRIDYVASDHSFTGPARFSSNVSVTGTMSPSHVDTTMDITSGRHTYVTNMDPGSYTNNVNFNNVSGRLRRDTSSIRYKDDVRVRSGTSRATQRQGAGVTVGAVAEARSVLDVDAVWYVPQKTDRPGDWCGFIAEDLDAAGLRHLVEYGIDADGNERPESVDYSRVAVEHHIVLQSFDDRLDALEAAMARALESRSE